MAIARRSAPLLKVPEAVGMAALGLLAILLPFELTNPLFSIGPIAVTTTELAMYFAIGVWGFVWLRTMDARWTPVHTAVTALACAIVLSAVFAPSNRELAFKFAFRSLSGCFVFLAAAQLVSTPRRAAFLIGAIVAGGVLSAIAGVAETWIPGAATTLLAFKTHPSRIGGFVRASGTFQYANTGAMYWEAVVPLVLTLGIWLGWVRGGKWWKASAVVAAVVVAQAITLSLSRAGLFVTMAALVGLIVIGRDSMRAIRLPAATSLVALIVLVLLNPAVSGLVGLRFGTADELTWYRAEYRSEPSSLKMPAGTTTAVNVVVHNLGRVTWPARGEERVALSYHWQRASGGPAVILDGLRSELPADLAPGRDIVVRATVLAPHQPGQYLLQWDLVQENVMWFSTRGAGTGLLPVEVSAPIRELPSVPETRWVQIETETRPRRLELWRASLVMWRERPLMGVGPDNFRHEYGPYVGRPRFDDRMNASSLYVETLVNLGLIGAAVLVALTITLGRLAWRFSRDRADPRRDILALGLLISVATFFVHGLIDYFFEFTPTLGLFWLTVGATVGLLGSHDPPSRQQEIA